MDALGDGLLVGKTPNELGKYVSGVLHEGCSPTNGTVLTLQSLALKAKQLQKRLVYQCHANCVSAADCVDTVAAFLIGAGKDHYFSTGAWNSKAADGDNFDDTLV